MRQLRRGGSWAVWLAGALLTGCGGNGQTDFLPALAGTRHYRLENLTGAGLQNADVTVQVSDLAASRASSLEQARVVLTSSDGFFANTLVALNTGGTNLLGGQAIGAGGVSTNVLLFLAADASSVTLRLTNRFGTVEGTGPAIVIDNPDTGGGGGEGDPASQPALSLSTTVLDFGAEATELTVDVRNARTGTLIWQVSESSSFVTVDPAGGSGAGTLTVTVDRTDLAPGEHTANLLVTSNGGSLSITCRVTVPEPA